MTPAARRLENSAEDNVEVLAISTSKARVDAKHDRFVRVESESKPVILFEILEIEVVALVRHFAGVVEQRAVEAAPDLPAVFRLGEDRVRPAEPVLPEPPERVVSAERGHQVERHDRVVRGAGRRYEEARGDYAASCEEPDELPEIRAEPVHGEAPGRSVGEVRVVEPVPPAAPRVLRLAIIDFDERGRAQVVDRLAEPWRRRRIESLLDRRRLLVFTGAQSGVQKLQPSASQDDREQAHAGA